LPAATAAPSSRAATVDLATVAVKLQGLPVRDPAGSFDITQWVQKWSDTPDQDQAVLTRAGFTDGYGAFTYGMFDLRTRTLSGPTEAMYILRCRTAAGARQIMQAFQSQQTRFTGYAEFTVAGVPGAIGHTEMEPPRGGGDTFPVWRVKFTRGPLYFEVVVNDSDPAYNGTAVVTQLAQQQAALAPAD
jgi:hypothetical protein